MPRSVPGLIADTFRLYRRYPLLFLALATGVAVPYQLIVLACTGAGQLTYRQLNGGTTLALFLIHSILITPLVSALHVHAVAEVREGGEPRVGSVARRGLAVLPVVVAAAIMSAIGIAAGLLALVIPGIVLWLRWHVVVQAAAIEDKGWTAALRSSWSLTKEQALRVAGFLLAVFVVVGVPFFLAGLPFRHGQTTLVSFLVGLALGSVTLSFGALADSLLYFDLRARAELADDTPPRERRSVDPRHYTDEDRPSGWYVDPEEPWQMRYWSAADEAGWHRKTISTPRGIRREWEG
ncbi:MAG TPA: hypothetical protein VF731_07185 [Solirubrobacterales bacterium]